MLNSSCTSIYFFNRLLKLTIISLSKMHFVAILTIMDTATKYLLLKLAANCLTNKLIS